MPMTMEQIVQALQTKLHLTELASIAGSALNELCDDVIRERIQAGTFWQNLMREALDNPQGCPVSPREREQFKQYIKTRAPQGILSLSSRLIGLRMQEKQVGLISAADWGISAQDFTETYYYNDQSDEFISFRQTGAILIRIYYSLDHTLGKGSEATLYMAFLGLARRISDDDSLPLNQQYVPLQDQQGRLLVSRNIIVAKKPHLPDAPGARAKVDVRRHQQGGINLRDLTLPQFYTQESKKTLPGLWSLPRFADFGANRCLYYEYVQGLALQNLLDSKELDILARLIVLKQMAQTLHYIHSTGYIHNDLKPQNVIISQGGIATIIDFGLTEKYLDADHMIDEPLQQKIVGTPLFMSPEQVTKRSKADPALNQIRHAAPIASQDERAYLCRTAPESIVMIDGIEFKEVAANHPGRTPFFHDSYINANVFCNDKGVVVPITGKSDVFCLGVNILVVTTGACHLPNPNDTKSIIKDLSTYNLKIPQVKGLLPDPLNIGQTANAEEYKEIITELVRDTLQHAPQRRPPAHEVATRLRSAIVACFGGDRTFFSTFDEECTYLRNRLYRRK